MQARPSFDPHRMLPRLHLTRAALTCGLLTKEEVISWADDIIMADDHPAIFFIDLALSGPRSKNDIIRYFSEYLDLEEPTVTGRPLLGLLHKQLATGRSPLDKTLSQLKTLQTETVLNGTEESIINQLSIDFDLASDTVHGTMEDVEFKTEWFLGLYHQYGLDNSEVWQELDLEVEKALEAYRREKQEEDALYFGQRKPWWKFW